MPTTKKSRRSRRSRQSTSHIHQTAADVLATAQVPPFVVMKPVKYTFRFILNNSVSPTLPWTTQMMLDLFSSVRVTGASGNRMFNNMKLLEVRLWSSPVERDVGATAFATIGLEFSPSLIAGFGGAPRTPYTATSMSGSKMAHLQCRPRRDELASQWFSAQQGLYTLFNINTPAGTILELDFLATFVNGETPVAVAYATGQVAGTIGVNNFGVTGCRSVGWTDLVNP